MSLESKSAPPESITIVGASLAGLRGAEAVRRADYQGPITLIGAEPHLPYDRPPLSKKVLSGVWELEKVNLITGERLSELDITIETNTTATGFDLSTRTLTTACADTSKDRVVDALMIATGARCRTIPGTEDIAGVHVLRGLDDCAALRRQLAAKVNDGNVERVVVIGAGFIGAEVAATAKTLGLEVTMIETADRPLQRVLNAEMGLLIHDIHTGHGVDVRCGVSVTNIVQADGHVTGIELSDGATIDADVVVVGIGVIPNIEWLEGSGLTIDDGIVCDETTLAAPGVTAAGDVARWPNPRFGGELMRVEQWDNAVSMGPHAALRLLDPGPGGTGRIDTGQRIPYDPVPWFWSDQYDRKIQLAGRITPDDEMRVVEGSIEERRFVSLFGRDDRLVGVFGMNRPRHVMQYKGLLDQAMSFSDALTAEF